MKVWLIVLIDTHHRQQSACTKCVTTACRHMQNANLLTGARVPILWRISGAECLLIVVWNGLKVIRMYVARSMCSVYYCVFGNVRCTSVYHPSSSPPSHKKKCWISCRRMKKKNRQQKKATFEILFCVCKYSIGLCVCLCECVCVCEFESSGGL